MKLSTVRNLLSLLLLAGLLLPACGDAAPTATQGEAEAISMLGDDLFPLEHTDASLKANLAAARKAYDLDPTNEESAIWYGRRLAYLDRYREAIQVYTAALKLHPNSAKLLRHRGHRFISTRDFPSAIRDLSRAAELIDSLEDEVEPDGVPNARNEPRSTLKFNVWYHLGLAYFFNGDISQAYSAFGEAYAISKINADLLCAASHWLYITTRRLGMAEDAELLLDDITLELDVIENADYQHLLLMYRGFYTPEEVMDVSDPLSRATRGFGVGHFSLVNGETGLAHDTFLQVVDEGNWPAFGAIAAEVELARIE